MLCWTVKLPISKLADSLFILFACNEPLKSDANVQLKWTLSLINHEIKYAKYIEILFTNIKIIICLIGSNLTWSILVKPMCDLKWWSSQGSVKYLNILKMWRLASYWINLWTLWWLLFVKPDNRQKVWGMKVEFWNEFLISKSCCLQLLWELYSNKPNTLFLNI